MQLCVPLCLLVLVASVATAVTNKQTKITENRRDPSGVRSSPGFTRVYSGYGESGYSYDFTDYVPDMKVYNFDDVTRSTCQTGLWFYYENVDYNRGAGAVFWKHGIEYCSDMPRRYADMTSSLRYAGSPYYLNGDSFTLYEGQYFTASEYWGDQGNYPTIDYMDDQASSVVVTGASPWTFYTGEQYSGSSVCLYPNTDHDASSDHSTSIDFGIFGTMNEIHMRDNSISSVAKGCHTATVVRAQPPPGANVEANGSSGIIHRKEQ